jgi:hypothetical protein
LKPDVSEIRDSILPGDNPSIYSVIHLFIPQGLYWICGGSPQNIKPTVINVIRNAVKADNKNGLLWYF